jgi:hypothetical protein
MGCNCAGSKTISLKYIYTDSNGRQYTYSTDIEARAAQVRAGGGGSIRTEPK